MKRWKVMLRWNERMRTVRVEYIVDAPSQGLARLQAMDQANSLYPGSPVKYAYSTITEVQS